MKKKQPKFVFCLCTRLQDIHLSPEMQKEAQLGSCTGEEKGLCIFTGALFSAKVQQRSQTSDSKAHLVGDQMPEGQRKGRGAATGRSTCRRRCSEKAPEGTWSGRKGCRAGSS